MKFKLNEENYTVSKYDGKIHFNPRNRGEVIHATNSPDNGEDTPFSPISQRELADTVANYKKHHNGESPILSVGPFKSEDIKEVSKLRKAEDALQYCKSMLERATDNLHDREDQVRWFQESVRRFKSRYFKDGKWDEHIVCTFADLRLNGSFSSDKISYEHVGRNHPLYDKQQGVYNLLVIDDAEGLYQDMLEFYRHYKNYTYPKAYERYMRAFNEYKKATDNYKLAKEDYNNWKLETGQTM